MVPVVFSGNKKIFDGLLLSVMSLAKNSDEELNVYVLTMDLSFDDPRFEPFDDKQIQLLTEVLQKKNPKSKAVKLDVTQEYIKHLMGGKNHKNERYIIHFTNITLYNNELQS